MGTKERQMAAAAKKDDLKTKFETATAAAKQTKKSKPANRKSKPQPI